MQGPGPHFDFGPRPTNNISVHTNKHKCIRDRIQYLIEDLFQEGRRLVGLPLKLREGPVRLALEKTEQEGLGAMFEWEFILHMHEASSSYRHTLFKWNI